MKPVHERNQECLPPKKRDLPVNNSSTINSNISITGGSGTSGISTAGGEDTPPSQNSVTSAEAQSRERVQAQPGVHYGVEGTEGVVGLPMDQYSMLYKVALPAGTYSPTNLHPVLSHAYSVPSPVLQHTTVPYAPLAYPQIQHSTLQFVSSPYPAVVPYAMPPSFVPSNLIPHQSSTPQPHLVPYPPVIQEGVVSSPPQPQGSTHSYTKMAAPLILPSEQAPIGTVGMLPTTELSPRGVPVYFHPTIRSIQPQRDLEQERELNGGDRDHGGREGHQDVLFSSRGVRIVQELHQEKVLKSRKPEGRASPAQSSTPDIDLEVQQVVGRLASPVHGTSRREAAHIPLNLSQSSQRSRQAQGEVRTAYPVNTIESRAHQQQQIVQQGHAVVLANGQPVLVPLDYQQQQHFQPNDVASAAINASPATFPKVKEAISDQAEEQIPCQQGQATSQQISIPNLGALPQAPLLAPTGPSHFMKGAIIQLATGELKRVEDLQTQDFVRSAEVSGGLKIDSSMVVDIHASQQRPGLVGLHFNVGEQQSKVTIDVPLNIPFLFSGRGGPLVALSGLHSYMTKAPQQVQNRTPTKTNSTPQPMGPPAPQHTPRSQNQIKMERIHRERDKEEPMQIGSTRSIEVPLRTNRTSEHSHSQSNYYLHSEGHGPLGTGVGVTSIGVSQRRWSAPGIQRYNIKNEEGNFASLSPSGSSRPSFISQEVKLSIEGRSNAGK
ncbi:hypothetical protein DNTS_009645 [Danionella cerebrum]|uniref:AXH domain-containing protein n=1 Tax=Danionella cerebrum TaxID=2873325 RepID=A0A553R4R5_9TELE|nr:hypothetical protein DNTS_009645 [Danionella translucida]